MIGSGFTIFATVPVLIAAWKNCKPNLLSPWLVIKFLLLVNTVIYWFYLGILVILGEGAFQNGTSDFILVACIGLGKILWRNCLVWKLSSFVSLWKNVAICSYYWLVVYSYYHELNKSDMKTRPEEKNEMRYHKCWNQIIGSNYSFIKFESRCNKIQICVLMSGDLLYNFLFILIYFPAVFIIRA